MRRLLVRALLSAMPSEWAARLVYFLAAKPARLTLREPDRVTLAQAEQIKFGLNEQLTAWSWGQGPCVILVHGWGGRGSQMLPMAQAIAQQGFRAIIFDSTGHGVAPAGRFSFRQLMLDTEALSQSIDEPIHAYVGHSAGGLAVMLGCNEHRLKAEKVVCICAPKYPYVPIQMIRRLLNPPERVIRLCKAFYAKEFKSRWEELKQGFLYVSKPNIQLMMLYDKSDTTVHHTDGAEIKAQWPQTELHVTPSLGHQKILWDEQSIQRICDFLELKKESCRAA